MGLGVLVAIVVLGAMTGLAVGDMSTADQTIETEELSPGETTTVTVDIELDSSSDPAVYQEFDPAVADVEIVTTDPSAAISSSTDGNDELFVTWEETTTATVQYEVTVPEAASEGETYQLTGDVETGDDTTDITGDETLVVVAEEDSSGSDSGSDRSSDSGSDSNGDDGTTAEVAAAIDTAPSSATTGEEITLSATASVGEERTVDSYEWVINGTTLTGKTVSDSFDTAGTHDVELTVIDDRGGTNTTTTTVTVEEPDDEGSEPDDEPPVDEESSDETSTSGETDDGGLSSGITAAIAIAIAIVGVLSIALFVRRR